MFYVAWRAEWVLILQAVANIASGVAAGFKPRG
jgi:hypothetical protein